VQRVWREGAHEARDDRSGEEQGAAPLELPGHCCQVWAAGLVHWLQAVHLNCIDSDIVAYYCKISNPTNVVYEMAEWIKDEFKRRCGKHIVVTVGFEGANDGQ
jgi:hypothetical protein